jgi:hypothetical protein
LTCACFRQGGNCDTIYATEIATTGIKVDTFFKFDKTAFDCVSTSDPVAEQMLECVDRNRSLLGGVAPAFTVVAGVVLCLLSLFGHFLATVTRTVRASPLSRYRFVNYKVKQTVPASTVCSEGTVTAAVAPVVNHEENQ